MNEYERRSLKEDKQIAERSKEAYHQAKGTKERCKDEKRRCFKCNKVGHLANNCDSKLSHAKEGRKYSIHNTLKVYNTIKVITRCC